MSLRSDLETLIANWTEQAETASSAGQTRAATTFYNTAEAVEAILEANPAGDIYGDLDVEHGLHWPDGRVTMIDPSQLAAWDDNPLVVHVTRRVGAWQDAAAPKLAAA